MAEFDIHRVNADFERRRSQKRAFNHGEWETFINAHEQALSALFPNQRWQQRFLPNRSHQEQEQLSEEERNFQRQRDVVDLCFAAPLFAEVVREDYPDLAVRLDFVQDIVNANLNNLFTQNPLELFRIPRDLYDFDD